MSQPPSSFLVITGGLPRRVVPLPTGATVVGRGADAGLVLPHLEISRHHCRLQCVDSTCTLEDLGSARGTLLNGERIGQPTQLSPGDKITIGPAVLQFGIGELPEVESGREVALAAMIVHGVPADRVEVLREFTIGREPGVEVWLNHPDVSRRHAKIEPLAGGGCVVSDLHSTGGSFVNGHRFDTHNLTVGDRLQIGLFCFQYDGQALNRVAHNAGGTVHARGLVARTRELTLLDDVTISIPASRFVGIIGPSGAGKSTLLHSLSGMRAPQAGTITINERDVYAHGGACSFGFVPQEDIVHPELTVAKALRFSARLRLPAGTPGFELQRLIVQTMTQLGLLEHASKPIARLSGGQRKRVSVGVELLAKPAVLFLDEPSSGLDPATEFQLMELLRDLADTGCTIICTTHVMENAYLMDQLVVIADGCIAFQGSAQEIRDFFRVGKLTALYDKLLERPASEWQEAFAARQISTAVDFPAPAPRAERPARRAMALPILLHRQWAILRSDWRNFAILAGQPLIIGALVGWVTEERELVLFFAYLATLWFGCSNAGQEIVKEIAIYRRERLVGVRTHAYLTAKFLFLSTLTILQALLLYGCLLLVEGERDGAIGLQIAALLGTAISAVGIGLAISACARSGMQAVMFVPLVLIPQIVFSGKTVPASEMSDTVRAVSGFSPTFGANTVMDTSYFWLRPVTSDVTSEHYQAYRNLGQQFSNGELFNAWQPAAWALFGHVLWALGMYAVAWFALRSRERM